MLINFRQKFGENPLRVSNPANQNHVAPATLSSGRCKQSVQISFSTCQLRWSGTHTHTVYTVNCWYDCENVVIAQLLNVWCESVERIPEIRILSRHNPNSCALLWLQTQNITSWGLIVLNCGTSISECVKTSNVITNLDITQI